MRQILAIHRHGSFVKAAAELGVAQPTLSKSIARLEDELGLVLFDRSAGSGAKVTPMGSLVVERADRIIVEAGRLARDVELVGGGQLGEARVAVGAGLRDRFLPALGLDLASRYRSLRLSMLVLPREDLLHGLLSGGFDIIIAVDGPDVRNPDLVTTEVFRDRAAVVAAPQHPLAGRRRIPIETFARYPSASANLTSGFAHPEILGLVGEAAQTSSFFICNDYETTRRLAKAGLATAMMPAHNLTDDLASGELVELDLDWRLELTVVAVMTRAAGHSPILREIVERAVVIGQTFADGRVP